MCTSDPKGIEVVGGCLLSATVHLSPLQTSGLYSYRKLLPGLAALSSTQGHEPRGNDNLGRSHSYLCARPSGVEEDSVVRAQPSCQTRCPIWLVRTCTQGPGTPTCQLPLPDVPPQQIPGSGAGVPQLLA